MQLNVTAFHTTYDDFQVQTAITTGPTIVFRKANVGELETRGIELESMTLLSERFSLMFNAAYIDAVVNEYEGAQCYRDQTEAQGCFAGFQTVDGGELPNSPEWKYTVALQYEQGLSSLPFDLYANVLYVWQDEIQFGLTQAPATREGSYGLANLRLGLIDKNDRWEVTAFVNNVFDESYRSEMIDFGVLFGNTEALVHITPRNAERYAGLTAKLSF
jgi:iron complex outermembrane receptor protein